MYCNCNIQFSSIVHELHEMFVDVTFDCFILRSSFCHPCCPSGSPQLHQPVQATSLVRLQHFVSGHMLRKSDPRGCWSSGCLGQATNHKLLESTIRTHSCTILILSFNAGVLRPMTCLSVFLTLVHSGTVYVNII